MPFQRPTLPELITRTTADLASRLGIVGVPLRRSVVATLARVYAGAAHAVHGHLDWLQRQLFAVTADAELLDDHGEEVGVPRIPGAYAVGEIYIAGVDETLVPEGTRWRRNDGVEYVSTEAAAIDAGVATVLIKARRFGAASNAVAGTAVSLISPVAGIQSAGVVDAAGISLGADPEPDDAYRSRILERKRNTFHGGAMADYVRWAREVAGVTRVYVRAGWMGAGTVGVTFVLDGELDIIPDPAKVAEVQAYLDDPIRKPVTADIVVFQPATRDIDIELSVSPDTPAVRATVAAELMDLLTREGEPGVTIYPSRLSAAISGAPGESWHALQVPVSPIVLAANEIPVLGEITWL